MFRAVLRRIRGLRREWMKRRWIPRKYWDITQEEYLCIENRFYDGLNRLEAESSDEDYLDNLSLYLEKNREEMLLVTARQRYWKKRLDTLTCTF